MKTALLILALLTFNVSSNSTSPQKITAIQDKAFCMGWEDGFCSGYKSSHGQFAVCPVAPVCPVPLSDCPTGYDCGYARGFIKGRNKL